MGHKIVLRKLFFTQTILHSLKMGNMLERYKELFAKQNLTEAEMIEKTELAHEFKNVPGKLASRIQSEFASIEG